MSIMMAMMLAGASTPLAPSGKWIVEFADNRCLMQRDFGTGSRMVTLGLRPLPLSTRAEAILVTRNRLGRDAVDGKVVLRLPTAPEPIFAAYTSVLDTSTHRRLATFDLPREALAALAVSKTVSVRIDEWEAGTLAVSGIGNAMKVLAACEEDLVLSWGIAKAARAAIATPAEDITVGPLLADRDYPPSAFTDGRYGVTSLLWTIGTDGRAHDCRVVRSARHPELDKSACDAITRRARYKPALDVAGRPIESWESRTIRWVLHR